MQGSYPYKSKKPGPRPNKCIWCNEIQCSHCQCPGYPKCDHRPGEPCLRQRYKRRLVCNPCEKSKLKEETPKRTAIRSTPRERSRFFRRRSESSFPSTGSKSADAVLPALGSTKHYSFEALLSVASHEYRKAELQRHQQDASYADLSSEDMGLCMDPVSISLKRENNDTAAEELLLHSNHDSSNPSTPSFYPSGVRQFSFPPPLCNPHPSAPSNDLRSTSLRVGAAAAYTASPVMEQSNSPPRSRFFPLPGM